MTPRVVLGLLLAGLGLTAPAAGFGQEAWPAIRLALLQQWVVNQHQDTLPRLQTALDDGVVDRLVFSWQRGVISRQGLVSWKPVRVLGSDEAAPLGGRGEWSLGEIQSPKGKAAWTQVTVVPRTRGADDVVVLEVGGEINVLTQVLAAVLVPAPDGAFQHFRVERAALSPGPGVQAVRAYFGLPVAPPQVTLANLPERFRDVGGVGALVARSRVDYVEDGAVTPNGLADVSPLAGADWREGDRVLLRVPMAALRAGAPPLVLVWKDRRLAPDPQLEFPRKSALPLRLDG